MKENHPNSCKYRKLFTKLLLKIVLEIKANLTACSSISLASSFTLMSRMFYEAESLYGTWEAVISTALQMP